jgi:hypothetical protein
MARESKGGKCMICGYNRCSAALDFHHRDPNQKDFSLSVKGLTRSWEKIKKEIDKCVIFGRSPSSLSVMSTQALQCMPCTWKVSVFIIDNISRD